MIPSVEETSPHFPAAVMALIFGGAISAGGAVHMALSDAPTVYVFAPVLFYAIFAAAVYLTFRAFKPYFGQGTEVKE